MIIIRGASGSGKSTFASIFPDATVCEADKFFLDEKGKYNFNQELLGQAHSACWYSFMDAVKANKDLIIVSNTNTRESEFNGYKDYAEKHGYKVFVVILENRHGGKNCHGVPDQTLEKQKDRIKSSIKL